MSRPLGPPRATPKLHTIQHPDVSPQPISLKDFAVDCSRILQEESFNPYRLQGASDNVISTEMNVSIDEYKSLKEAFNPRVFLQQSNLPSVALGTEPTFALTKEKRFYLKDAANTGTGNCLSKPVVINVNPPRFGRVNKDEIVLSIVFFNRRKRRKEFEYLVLGSQKLTELGDVILCPSNFLPLDDCSHLTFEEAQRTVRKRKDQPSSYFFINNVFYNDLRYSHAVDYSKTITSWIKDKNIEACSKLDDFSSALMEGTRFMDLKIRLGYPYLYCHCGDCEHLVVFQQTRLLHPEDSQNYEEYPKLMFLHRKQVKECSVCKRSKAVWVTGSDHLALEDPSLFCDACYKMLHLDEHGKKLYDFKAYPYVDLITPDMLIDLTSPLLMDV